MTEGFEKVFLLTLFNLSFIKSKTSVCLFFLSLPKSDKLLSFNNWVTLRVFQIFTMSAGRFGVQSLIYLKMMM